MGSRRVGPTQHETTTQPLSCTRLSHHQENVSRHRLHHSSPTRHTVHASFQVGSKAHVVHPPASVQPGCSTHTGARSWCGMWLRAICPVCAHMATNSIQNYPSAGAGTICDAPSAAATHKERAAISCSSAGLLGAPIRGDTSPAHHECECTARPPQRAQHVQVCFGRRWGLRESPRDWCGGS